MGVNRTVRNEDDSFSEHNNLARANIDLAIGLEWGYPINDRSTLTFNLGWEYHYFFDQNFFRAVQDTDLKGDLCLHGLTLGASYNF